MDLERKSRPPKVLLSMFPFFLFNQVKVDNSPAVLRRMAKVMLLYVFLVGAMFGFFYLLVY